MGAYSVNQEVFFINRQVMHQEKIEACLWKLEALITVAMLTEDFYDLSEHVLQNYFSVANDLIKGATEANQASLGELLQQNAR